MSVPKPASPTGPDFCDPPPFPVSCYVQKHSYYLDASRFTEMRATDCALAVRDRHKMLRDTDVEAGVRLLLFCGGREMSVSRCAGYKEDFPFVRCYK